jgi:sulfatase modifying factor 1
MNKLTLLIIVSLLAQSPNHNWELVANKHWHIVDLPNQMILPPPAPPKIKQACLPGMAHVKGNMKQDPNSNPYSMNTIEELQKTTCIKWINKGYPERCLEFDRDKWLKLSANLSTQPMNFCMDEYEYPNQKGAYPLIYINWNEGKQICQAAGKRLCTETEWTFACEGEEAMPYPTGYVRPVNECNIDKHWIAYHPSALLPRANASAELDRLWQGDPSGSHPLCKSPFGVYDTVGNVDEWTQKSRPEGKFQSILKGGYWGPVRTRCRPSTRSHNEDHIFYQQGLRCCSDSQ